MQEEEIYQSIIESTNLVNTYGGLIIIKKIQKKQIPDYNTYIGEGKLIEIIEESKKIKPDIMIINNILKPRQIWNIDEMFFKNKYKIQVWDKVDLILKIFEKHATTVESKLQIELASIRHMGPRIFGMGMQLSRQAGGIGTRGIGETNIEIMKRHLSEQEKKIKTKLKSIQHMKNNQITNRKKSNIKTIAIIGYTNAGKSQLLHTLTKKNVDIKDKLFATLDTKIGKLYLPNKNNHVLISDTIGFIKDLPPQLIDAFKSTLYETINADILLHVIDISDPYIESKINTVNTILKELNIINKKIILVFNKVDLVRIQKNIDKYLEKFNNDDYVLISALKKIGIKELINTIEKNI